ncbi:hypothetical protein F0562_014241 [Nyssa sinensis]|uniref:Uncharacterized protein n=1 Tax=Nyssa sinensis TaxID=561372 RepID=A0A5J4ZMV7_9ASTE|nr:hypothetical protein F0562_014241 [Nyssa sinensis]
MGCLRQISLPSYILIINFVALTFAQPDVALYKNCTTSGTFNNDSTYGSNLKSLQFSLSSNIDESGFYHSSRGQDADTVNAVVLCRGDVELEICRSCVNEAIRNLTQDCANQREAIIFYDKCMLRYSDQSIFGIMAWGPGFEKWNIYENVSDNDWNTFTVTRRSLLLSLRDRASSGDSRLKYSTGEEQVPNYNTMYTLVQCTPDLSLGDCKSCLDACMQLIPTCCNRSIGGAVYKPTCNLRYELGTGPFYNQTVPYAVPPPPPPPPSLSGIEIFLIVASIVIFVILTVSISIYLRKRKQRNQHHKIEKNLSVHEAVDGIDSVESLQYDFATIRVATDNFSAANKLGEGGFGPVYKGRLPNGQEVAVKRLSKGSGQGEQEFKNEMSLLAQLQHRNLVKLLGFCLEGEERLLIYELLTNGSLDQILFDTINGQNLDWDGRYKIIRGVAKGLLYLHEDSRLRIIHRDLKPSNVLLSKEMDPKISDFGMAKLFLQDETQGNTMRIAGTLGYMAPEVFQGNISVKSDVYSFGVLVLEIVSGHKIHNNFENGNNTENLLSYAWRIWREGEASNLIQPTMKTSSSSIPEIMRCIHIGLLCVQENVANRPPMASVVLMLHSMSLPLPEPLRPAFFQHSSVETNMEMPLLEASNYSVNEASITELHGR